MALALFAAHCILQSADRVLHLTCGLVDLTFSFQLLVAEDLSDAFFHGSLGLLCLAFDSIFVHCSVLGVCGYRSNDFIVVSFPQRMTVEVNLRSLTELY